MSNGAPDLDDSAIAAAVSTYSSIPPTSIDAIDRFMGEVHRVAEVRAQAGWEGEDDEASVSVFLMFAHPRAAKQQLERKNLNPVNVTDLRPSGTPIMGKVFLLDAAGSNGSYIPLPVQSNDLEEWLAEIGFEGRPVAVAWRRTQQMTQRPGGITDGPRTVTIRNELPAASIENLLAALEAFHATTLEVPGNCKDLWHDAGKHVPGRFPEKTIQYHMRIALGTVLSLAGVRAEEEDKSGKGRIDIRLLASKCDGPLEYWAIIELKVIKSKRFTDGKDRPIKVYRNSNVEAIKEGVVQADQYKKDRKAEEGLLEIFDLRENKAEDIMNDPSIVDCIKAADPKVYINIRPLHGSARLARQAGFSASSR